MILHPPFEISPSLCASLRVGDSWISLLGVGPGQNRGTERVSISSMDWSFEILMPSKEAEGQYVEYVNSDLNTTHRSIVQAFDDFLCFLTCYDTVSGEEPPFPPAVMEWAKQHEYDLEELRGDIQDKNGFPDDSLIEL